MTELEVIALTVDSCDRLGTWQRAMVMDGSNVPAAIGIGVSMALQES